MWRTKEGPECLKGGPSGIQVPQCLLGDTEDYDPPGAAQKDFGLILVQQPKAMAHRMQGPDELPSSVLPTLILSSFPTFSTFFSSAH